MQNRLQRGLLAILVAFATTAGVATAADSDPAPPPPGEMQAQYAGSADVVPGQVYAQNFPDPSVLLDNGTYYAYSTSTGGRYMPVITSSDLTNWTARPAYLPDPYPDPVFDPKFNDGLVAAPTWAKPLGFNHPHLQTDVWAPGVMKLGDRYLAYFATLAAYGDPVLKTPNRYCISVASSISPSGPFYDTTAGPLVCDVDPAGSIDPDPFVDPVTGRAYLTWKSEGTRNVEPSRIWTRELDATGLQFAPGSAQTELLRSEKRWEFQIVENPSMVRYNNRYLLFYSAHYWQSRDYSTAVAICDSPLGPCVRQGKGDWPLYVTRGNESGPGGADAFVAADGTLKLAYHAWNAPFTRYPDFPACTTDYSCTTKGQRYLHTATVDTAGDGMMSIGGGIDLTVGYTEADYKLLSNAARGAGMSPAELQTFGVYALVFITKLSGNDQKTEVTRPRPYTDGPIRVTSSYSPTDRVILDWLANHYVLTDAETLKAGTAFQAFIYWLSTKK